jgi:hypothetical protein
MSRHTRHWTAPRDVSIPVCSYNGDEWANVLLTDIQTVTPSDSGLIDIVYVVRSCGPNRLMMSWVKGESTIDQLLIALGWHAGMDHSISITEALAAKHPLA